MNSYRMLNVCILAGMFTACSSPDEGGNSAPATVTTAPAPALSYPTKTLPDGLVWDTNDTDPVFASEQAQRGGTYHDVMLSFPLTLRTVGPDSNGSFRNYILNNSFSLTTIHPDTLRPLPLLATHWAFGADGKTVYYRLNPDARWSDGTPVTADDFLFALDFMRSEFIVAPWYNNFYTETIVDVSKYDDYTVSVTGNIKRPPDDLLMYNDIAPQPRHFVKLDENWVQNSNWQVVPNTGPYQISRVEKGKFIEFTRQADWWGDKLKYLQNRFNVTTVRIDVIRDLETAYRHFLRGELDAFPLTNPTFWHDKVSDTSYQNGYINRIWFYNDIPQPKPGFYMNLEYELFHDRNVRYAFAHAMNFDKLLATLLRGDYERLPAFHTGYGEYSNPDIRPREFDLDKADGYLREAGWTERGPDGIRVKDGKRLAVTVSYGGQILTDRLVLLKEEAKKAGIELELQLLDESAAFKNVLEKKHQVAFMAWGAGLRPTYWEFFHSVNAHKPQTNNITNTDDPEIDSLIERFDNSDSTEERVALARELEQKVHDSGVYIPAWMVPYVRQAYWRWLKLPAAYGTRLTDDLFDVMGNSVFWIDDAEKQRTQAAMKANDKFEPVVIVEDRYKRGP